MAGVVNPQLSGKALLRHNTSLPDEKFDMRKLLLTSSPAYPKYNIQAF
jgi:hypothetical protein